MPQSPREDQIVREARRPSPRHRLGRAVVFPDFEGLGIRINIVPSINTIARNSRLYKIEKCDNETAAISDDDTPKSEKSTPFHCGLNGLFQSGE